MSLRLHKTKSAMMSFSCACTYVGEHVCPCVCVCVMLLWAASQKKALPLFPQKRKREKGNKRGIKAGAEGCVCVRAGQKLCQRR